MSIEPITAVAVVGVGAILPDAPDAATFWANVRGGRYSITEVRPGALGPRASTTTPTRRHPTRPTPRSAAGCATGRGIRWPGSCRSRRGSATPWTTPRSGQSPCTRAALLDYGWPERPLDGERTAVVLGNAMSGETSLPHRAAHRLSRSSPTSWTGRRRSRRLPSDVRKAISAEFGELRRRPLSRDHRGHHARRAGQLHGRPGGQPVRPPRPELRRRRGVRVGARRHRRVRRRAGRPRLRHRHRRWRRPQHGRVELREVLQDRGAVGHRHASVRRRRRRLRDGRGRRRSSCSSAWPTPSATATASTPCCAAWAAPATGGARASPRPTPSASAWPCERAWRNAGLSPAACGMIECHGTSTRVGDVVEVTSIGDAFSGADLRPGSVAIGSAKSNIGHLKAAAGAAGFLKAVLSIHHKELPPSLHVEELNPNIDWAASPFKVNTELRRVGSADRRRPHRRRERLRVRWHQLPRRARGVRARSTAHERPQGGGGGRRAVRARSPRPSRRSPSRRRCNGRRQRQRRRTAQARRRRRRRRRCAGPWCSAPTTKPRLVARLRAVHAEAVAGQAPAPAAPLEADLRAGRAHRHRLRRRRRTGRQGRAGAGRVRAAGALEGPARPRHLPRQRTGAEGRLPVHRPGLAVRQHAGRLRDVEPVVAETFDEADAVMTPLLGRPLTSYLFVDPADPDAVAAAEADLRRTEITQPAVLSVDLALTRLLGRLRHRARPRDGPQPRRVRRARRRRGADLRRRRSRRSAPGAGRWPT